MSAWLYETFIFPLTQTFFLKALIGGSIVAMVCGVVGCLVILRRMAFLGDALSHAMIAGIAGGYLVMKVIFGIEAHAPAMLIGSVIAAVLTVALIGFVSRVSRIKDDAAIGIMYCGVFAGGVVLVSVFRGYIHIDLMHFIMGDVLGVADMDLWVSAFVAAFVLSVIVLFFRDFQLTTFDPVMAASIGISVLLVDYVLTTCVSLVVVSAVSMVGVILVVGLLITPAATAYMLTDRLQRMMVLAALFGVTSVIGGLYISMWIDSAGGGAIMLFCTLQFVVVLFVAPRYGILADAMRRRRMVPQNITEDILRSIMRSPVKSLSLSELSDFEKINPPQLRRALRNLQNEGLVAMSGNVVTLSDKGELEANRIVRAHRLWETYLEHIGTTKEELHPRALELEHVGDEGAVGYLAHALGHPEHDPHGSPIPPSSELKEASEAHQLSVLRQGCRGAVVSVDPARAGEIALKPGDVVEVAGRASDAAEWIVLTGDGRKLRLNHDCADAVRVRIEA